MVGEEAWHFGSCQSNEANSHANLPGSIGPCRLTAIIHQRRQNNGYVGINYVTAGIHNFVPAPGGDGCQISQLDAGKLVEAALYLTVYQCHSGERCES